MKIFITLLLLALATFTSTAQAQTRQNWSGNSSAHNAAPQPSPFIEDSIQVADSRRWFRIYKPKSLRADAPAIVVLHGGTQSMRKIFNPKAGGTKGWLSVADREGALLIIPNGTNPDDGSTNGDKQNWNDLRWTGDKRNSEADDVGFIAQLVNTMITTHSLDKNRIYVTGASNGGMMTQRLLIERPDIFAGGAAFISSLPSNITLPRPQSPTPLLLVNGTKDPLVKWDGGQAVKSRSPVLPVRETVQWWIAANKASPSPGETTRLPDRNPDDGCTMTYERFPALPGGAPVHFITMAGGGHAMPSIAHDIPDTRFIRRIIGTPCKDAEGAELAWDFFESTR